MTLIACQHCRDSYQRLEGRGLCWHCYATPRVRAMYAPLKVGRKPSAEKPSLAPEARRTITPPRRVVTVSEPAYRLRAVKPDDGPTLGDWRAAWGKVDVVLTSDTMPSAIASTQRDVIRDAIRRLRTRDVGRISEYVVLPLDVVKRRMEEYFT